MGYGKFKGVLWLNISTSDKTYTYDERFAALKTMYSKYEWSFLVMGEEVCPSTERCHVDFYYEMPQPRKIKTEINKFGKVMGKGFFCLELAHGTAGENWDYSSKEGRRFVELGEPAKQGERNDLKENVAAITRGELTAETLAVNAPGLYHQYGRTLDKVEDIYLRKQFRKEMPLAYWLWGPTGVGKSHAAMHDYNPETHYIWKDDKGWQDGYRQQHTVVVNDFRGHIAYNDLLQMIDKWPYFVSRRSREPMPFTSPRIIITSSLPPDDVYNRRNTEDKIGQLLRRITVIHMTSPGQSLILPLTRQ